MVEKFGKRARLASDTTRAQLYFDTAEQNFDALNRFFGSRLFDSPKGRRIAARFGRLQTETMSASQAAREIAQAGATSLRTLREKVLRAVQRGGQLRRRPRPTCCKLRAVRASGEKPEQAWEAVLGHLYGDQFKDKVLGALKSPRAGGEALVEMRGDTIVQYPTADSLRAIDSILSSEKGGNLLPGDRLLAPDILGGMLKTILENGIRKNLIAERRLPFDARQLRGSDIVGDLEELTEAEIAERARQLLPFPREGVRVDVPEELQPATGRNALVYDKAAGFAERELASSGEALFRMLDNVPVRQRADVKRMASDAADLLPAHRAPQRAAALRLWLHRAEPARAARAPAAAWGRAHGHHRSTQRPRGLRAGRAACPLDRHPSTLARGRHHRRQRGVLLADRAAAPGRELRPRSIPARHRAGWHPRLRPGARRPQARPAAEGRAGCRLDRDAQPGRPGLLPAPRRVARAQLPAERLRDGARSRGRPHRGRRARTQVAVRLLRGARRGEGEGSGDSSASLPCSTS